QRLGDVIAEVSRVVLKRNVDIFVVRAVGPKAAVDRKREPRIGALKRWDARRDPERANAAGRDELHPAVQLVVELAHQPVNRRGRALHDDDVFLDPLPGLGQHDAIGSARHQLRVQPQLQIAQTLTHGRLRHLQGLGRRTDAAAFGDMQEEPQVRPIGPRARREQSSWFGNLINPHRKSAQAWPVPCCLQIGHALRRRSKMNLFAEATAQNSRNKLPENVAAEAAQHGLEVLDAAALYEARTLAAQLIGDGVATAERFVALQSHFGAAVFGLRQDGVLTGLLAAFPINAAGLAALEKGAFDAVTLDTALVSRPAEEPAAYYGWG